MIDLRSNTWAPMPGISNGMAGASSTSISTSALSRLPSEKRCLKLCARGLARVLAGERVEQAVHRRFLGRCLHRLAAALALEPNRFLDEVAGDLLDVAADVADLGELGRLDLDEGRVGELRQAPADLGLAAAGRADHQDVLRRDLLAQLGEAAGGASGCEARPRPRFLASSWPMICALSAATIALGVSLSFSTSACSPPLWGMEV